MARVFALLIVLTFGHVNTSLASTPERSELRSELRSQLKTHDFEGLDPQTYTDEAAPELKAQLAEDATNWGCSNVNAVQLRTVTINSRQLIEMSNLQSSCAYKVISYYQPDGKPVLFCSMIMENETSFKCH